MTEPATLEERIDRLESIDQIRQLPAKYALSVDMREFDALANLFVDDVYVSRDKSGRQAIKEWFRMALGDGLIGSMHGINGHIIDFESKDLASGIVYSRNDLEREQMWMDEIMIYLDRYERRDGRWYFQRRAPLFWYQVDRMGNPLGGGEAKLRWPGREWAEGGYHSAFPSWQDFWDGVDPEGKEPVKPPAPLYEFLKNFRRSDDMPKVRGRPNK